MSASLVGSEMCIRDRACSARSFKTQPQQPPALACPARVFQSTRVGSAEPVSYTHLTLPTICSV
eukprot:15371518-Alexandrium_andersonii.AAC.1